jgi:serine/threonine protein kinase
MEVLMSGQAVVNSSLLDSSKRVALIRAVLLQTLLALVLVLALEPVLRFLAPRGGFNAILWSAILAFALRLGFFELRRLVQRPEQRVIEACDDDDHDDRPWLLREPIGVIAGQGVLGTWWQGRSATRHVVRSPEGELASLVLARSAEEREALARERQALTALDRCPGFASLRSAGHLPSGEPFLIQSFSASPSAWQLAGHCSTSAVARLGLALSEALEAAHQRGLCLRSFALEDISVDEAGRVEFINLAQATELGNSHALRVSERLRVLAPELRSPAARADASADVYSLGVLVLELWAGETISVPGMSSAELMERAESVFTRFNEGEAARRLSVLLRETLSLRGDRPRSMARMSAALRWVLESR